MPFRIEFSPEFQEQRRHEPDDDACAVNLCVTGRAEGNHQVQERFARYPMVDDDGPLVTAGSVAHTAAIPIAFQHLLPETTEILLILSLQYVADGTHPMRENLRFPATAMHCVLFQLRHHITRSVFSKTTTSTSQP